MTLFPVRLIRNDKIDGFQIRRIEIEMPEQAVKIIEAEKKRNEY